VLLARARSGILAYKVGVTRTFFALGALVALLSVAFGAFGAHVLEPRLDARAMNSFQTAARYQMFHGVALFVAAWACERFPGALPRAAGWAFVVGVALFCGSLYALAFGSPRWFGAVAPLGGLSFMVGWGCLALAALLG
jgi:uncharacterized membrane protein YgdD (TMEM256/DUF423 family)